MMVHCVHLFLLFASVLAKKPYPEFPQLPYKQEVKNNCPVVEWCRVQYKEKNCTNAICTRNLINTTQSATACCPTGFDLTCCTNMETSIKWEPKKLIDLVTELDKKEECHNEEYYCFCDMIKHNHATAIAGMCCGEETCKCCNTDKTIQKVPVLNQELKDEKCERKSPSEPKSCYRCNWLEGSPATDCCLTNYTTLCDYDFTDIEARMLNAKRNGKCAKNAFSLQYMKYTEYDKRKICEPNQKWFWFPSLTGNVQGRNNIDSGNSGDGFQPSFAFMMVLLQGLIVATVY